MAVRREQKRRICNPKGQQIRLYDMPENNKQGLAL